MEQTQRASERLAARTASRVEALWDQAEAGVITLATFRSLASAVIVQANTAGVTLADVGLAGELTRNLRRPTAALGIQANTTQTDQRRVSEVIDTVLELDPEDITEPAELAASRRSRLAQVARSEPLLTVSTTVTAGMVHRKIPGWTRQVDANPCAKCITWADGVVRPAATPMRRHPGCACIQQPVLS